MKEYYDITKGYEIVIDVKTIKDSYNKSKRKGLIHMVRAFSGANQIVLEQVKRAEKYNEITVVPELLNFLNIRGCLVIIDTIGC